MNFDLDLETVSISRSAPEKPVNPIFLSYKLAIFDKTGTERICPPGKYAMLYSVRNGDLLEGRNGEYKIRITYGKTFGDNSKKYFTVQYFKNNVVRHTDHTANMEWIIKYYLKWF